MVNGSTSFMDKIFNGPTIIAIMVVAFLIVVIFLVIKALSIQRKGQQKNGRPPRGYYLNKGISTYMPLGFAVSLPIGFLFHNLAVAVILGPIVGLVLGALIGRKGEIQHEKELRTLSGDEKKLKILAQRMLTGLIVLAIILYFVTYVILR